MVGQSFHLEMISYYGGVVRVRRGISRAVLNEQKK